MMDVLGGKIPLSNENKIEESAFKKEDDLYTESKLGSFWLSCTRHESYTKTVQGKWILAAFEITEKNEGQRDKDLQRAVIKS